MLLLVVALNVLLAVAVLAVGWLLAFGEGVGGMRSTYPAADGDPKLTAIAREALPIVEALERFHDEYGHYPDDVGDLRRFLPGVPITPLATGVHSVNGWTYVTRSPDGFVLDRRLGWDPSLRYHRDGVNGGWVFEPGDGSSARPILLNPQPILGEALQAE